MAQDTITFSFGKNWRDYVETVAEDALHGAMNDIVEWLGRERVADKTVLDIGCGSGIHSLCFHTLGAREEFTGEFLVVPPDSYRRHDLRFLDGMTVGELAGELALPIKRTWHEVLGLPEPKIDRHTPILSHDYGSVTSVST